MDVGKVVVRTAAEVADKIVPFSGPFVAEFLSDALDVQKEQLDRLRAIEGGLQRLLEGPGREGRLKLDELRLPHRKPREVQRLLLSAADDFREAISLQPDGSFAMAQACLEFAEVSALRRDPEAIAALRHQGLPHRT